MIKISNNGSELILIITSNDNKKDWTVTLDRLNAANFIMQCLANLEQLEYGNTSLSKPIFEKKSHEPNLIQPPKVEPKKPISVEDFLSDVNKTIQDAVKDLKKSRD